MKSNILYTRVNLFLILCSVVFSFSQNNSSLTGIVEVEDTVFSIKIHPSFEKWSVQLTMISLGNEYPFSTVYKAKLIIKSTNKLIQDISDTSNQCIVADYEFLDVNFDGYLDIRFVDNIDMAANTSYHYWIFDKQMKKYVFNKSFSEVLINELNIDSINHTIQSTCRIGCAGRCESVYVYRVESEKLILVEQSIDSEEYVNDELQIITKHYKLVNGEMIENN